MFDFTPRQLDILRILADGKCHKRDDILEELGMNANGLNVQITYIRKLLGTIGQGIVCELHKRSIHYRHVKFIGSEGNKTINF